MDTQFDMSEATEWFDYLRSCGRKENTTYDLQEREAVDRLSEYMSDMLKGTTGSD